MDWDKLRIFHNVAEVKNLTHAGQLLNLSQSAVSRQISALESDLSLSLFNRHARGLILTAEGEILFKTTRNIFAQISATTSQLEESHQQLKGTLKIATTIALGSVWLAPRLSKFCKNYPDLNFHFILTDGEIDFTMREADIAVRFGQGHVNPDLIEESLFTFSLNIYGTQSYLKTYGTPQKPEDLDHHRLITFGSHAIAPVEHVNWILRIGAPTGTVRQPFLVMNNAYGILQSVRNGLGIAVLAEFIANDHKELIHILPSIECPTVKAYLVYPSQLADSKRLEVFRNFIKQEIKNK